MKAPREIVHVGLSPQTARLLRPLAEATGLSRAKIGEIAIAHWVRKPTIEAPPEVLMARPAALKFLAAAVGARYTDADFAEATSKAVALERARKLAGTI